MENPRNMSLFKYFYLFFSQNSLEGEDKLSLEERNRLLRLEKRRLMKDLQKLENFVKLSRTRLAGFYVYFEQQELYRIPREIVAEIFERIRVPVETFVIDILCDALEFREMIDYRLVFEGGYTDLVKKYMEKLKSNADLTKSIEKIDSSEKDGNEIESVKSVYIDDANPYCMSTMSGDTGVWARKSKEESHQQYEKLMEFCLEHNITLNRSLVERGTVHKGLNHKGLNETRTGRVQGISACTTYTCTDIEGWTGWLYMYMYIWMCLCY